LRLDKFLKIACIFKTRSSAEKAISKGDILLNDKTVKPALLVKPGDILTISFLLKKVKYRILKISEKSVSKQEAKELTEILGEEKFEF